MKIENCNPYIRAAEIQPAIMEGNGPRKAYDHRLFCILEGRGTAIIGGTAYPLDCHTLILLAPAVDYYFVGKMRTVVLNFDLTRNCSHRKIPICPPPVDAFVPGLLFDSETILPPDPPMIVQADPYTRSSLLRIVEEFHTEDNNADALTSALLKMLLAELYRERSNAETDLCKKVTAYIRINAAQISENSQIAEAFGYHVVYLGEVFRKITGKTLHSAVLDERIALACRWLSHTDISVADIAEACGFCSRTHFCTTFKRRTGQTPSEYRKDLA